MSSTKERATSGSLRSSPYGKHPKQAVTVLAGARHWLSSRSGLSRLSPSHMANLTNVRSCAADLAMLVACLNQAGANECEGGIAALGIGRIILPAFAHA
jgi:hypothetical protein